MTEPIAQTAIPNPDVGYGHGRSAVAVNLSFEEQLLWLAVALCPFQDTFLQDTPLHLPGASFSYLPILTLFMLAIVRHLLRTPFQVKRASLVAVVYIGIVCARYALGPDGTIYWHMAAPLAIETSLMAFVVFRLDFRNNRLLRTAVYCAFLFTITGILSELLLGPSGIPPLQTTPSQIGRLRGFSLESSTLSVQIVVSGMLTAHFLKGRWKKLFIGVLTCAMLVLSSSKGGLICLLLCAVVLGVVRSRTSLLAKVSAMIVVAPVIYLGGMLVLSAFGSIIDLQQTSSIATRISMAIYALITVAHNPFGVGFTGFLPSIPKYLPAAMASVERLIPIPLAFGEVSGYLYPPQIDADCKTFFFDYFAFFGLPFAIAFFTFFISLMKKLAANGDDWLFIGVLFSALAMMTYYSTTNTWAVPLLLGISLRGAGTREDAVCLQ